MGIYTYTSICIYVRQACWHAQPLEASARGFDYVCIYVCIYIYIYMFIYTHIKLRAIQTDDFALQG